MGKMKFSCIGSFIINKSLSEFFSKLGCNIGRKPYIFITAPVLLSLSASFGILNISTDRDLFDVIMPDIGKTFAIKNMLEEDWNSSLNTDEIRFSQMPNSMIIFFMKKGGGNMLEKETLLEIRLADQIVRNTTIKIRNNRTINYTDLCAIMQGKCFQNPIIDITGNVDAVLTKKYKFKYPVDINHLTYSFQLFGMNLGGVTTDSQDYVNTVKSIKLNYFFQENDTERKEYIKQWSDQVMNRIKKHHFKFVEVIPNSSWSIEQYTKHFVEKLVPMIPALIAFSCIFSMLTSMSRNLIRSKPWLGIAAVVSAGLAISTSFGLLRIIGVENTYCNICIPFLVLVTEIDDAYVLIASWRITNPQDNIEKRMADTYTEAGISIALTSLTNFLSYCIGMMSPFPVVRIFCYYSATCMFFTFFFQITFFGGCMALSGYREEKNLHPFTFRSYSSDDSGSQDNQAEFFMSAFRDKLEKIHSSLLMKIIILVVYFINLGFGIWGSLSLGHGLDMQNVYSYDSDISKSFRAFYKYYTEYSFPLHIIINKTLDYSDIKVQQSIEELIRKFESHPHVAESRFTVSWLKYYKEFQTHPVAKFSLNGYNMSNKNDFVHGLRDVFLRFKAAQQFSKDVVFSDDGSDIIRSRFFVMTKQLSSRQLEVEILSELWKMAEKSPLPILIHCVLSDIIEQGIVIKNMVYQLFWITGILIGIVFFSVIPNLFCALVVVLSVVSTVIETIGYMTMMNVNLDIFSLLSLILCIGFCVNYPTHISYAFIMSSYKIPKEKLKDALYRISFPIFQGSLSNILGILFMFNNTYIFLTFLKIFLLVTVHTAFHALFVIPLLLSLIYSNKYIQNTKYHFINNKAAFM